MNLRARLEFLLLCALAACSAPAPRALPWEARFDDPALAERVAVLEAEIRDGSCSGTARWSLAFDPDAPPAEMGPPTLPTGRYGFTLTARDAQCVRFATGCVEVDLPRPEGARLAVTLAARADEPACDAVRCTDGLCASAAEDGGPSDGSTDGGADGGTDGGNCSATRADCNGDAGDGCETPLDTPTDCGRCGTRCAFWQATPGCTAGACVVSACMDGWADCNVRDDDGCERSTRTPDDCGGCGVRCELPNAVVGCSTGVCRLDACRPGFADCDGVESNGCEASLAAAASCGACGAACSGATPLCGVDATTGARTCVASCAGTAGTSCGTSCVDTASDPQHCGACGTACATPRGTGRCTAGACTVDTCDPLFGDCNGTAADGCERLLASTSSCGACDATCGDATGSFTCAEGTCRAQACATGRADCDGLASTGCEADLRSPATCGGCTAICEGTTPVCSVDADGRGGCVETCPAPTMACGDRCLDTSSDVANCGGCGLPCMLPRATATCAASRCAVASCTAGFGDCNDLASDGCEATLDTDPAHCGACGRACPAVANGTSMCVGGACVTQCVMGFADCDGMASNGCEADLATSRNHCGMCGNRCMMAGRSCVGGICGA